MNDSSKFYQQIQQLPLEKRLALEKLLIQHKSVPLPQEPDRPSFSHAETITLPATATQKGRLFRDQWLQEEEIQTSPHHLSLTFHLQGLLNITALQYSIDTLLQRHAALRAVLCIQDGEYKQLIRPHTPTELAILDIQDVQINERTEKAAQIVSETAVQPFDIAHDMLFRILLVRFSAEEHVLLIVIEHLVADGWSADLLLHELSTLYHAFNSGLPNPLAPLPLPYPEFILEQEKRLKEQNDQLIAYWSHKLEKSSPLPAVNYPDSKAAWRTIINESRRKDFQGRWETAKLSETLTSDIRKFNQLHHTTLFEFLLTTLKLLVYQHTGNGDVGIVCPMVNRGSKAEEMIVGWLSNLVTLRTDLSDSPTFIATLQRVRQNILEAYEYQAISQHELLRLLSPQDYGRFTQSPFLYFDVNTTVSPFELSGLSVQPYQFPRKAAAVNISIWGSDAGKHIELAVLYASCRYTTDSIQRMLSEWVALIEHVIPHPEESVLPL